MPIAEKNGNIYAFPLSKDGVNLHKNILEMSPTECFLAQNCRWVNGMTKRGGQSLLTSTEVVASKKITGLHKFYKGDGTSQLLAAAGTLVKYYTAPATWTTIGQTFTTGLQTYMTTWGALNKVYICNGTDKMVSWDGTNSAQITISDGIPTQALPYQDRLLTIIGGTLTWSASFDDTGGNWGTASNIGIKPDTRLYGMTYHSVTSSSAGYETKVLLAGANGMYLFSATDLRWPSTTGDYIIQPLAIPVGCNSPRSMVWTPYGTIWLGIDRQVYMLPFGQVTPVPIGARIQSKLSSGLLNLTGIETIPTTALANAAAVYSNGYYILSVAGAGSSTNNLQWWLDVQRLSQDEKGNWGPWYGPMTGQNISCFFSQTGNGDGGELMAGEHTAKGYVYQVARDDANGDIDPTTAAAKAISVIWMSPYNPLADPLRCDVHKVELNLLGTSGQINIDFYDIDQLLKTGDNFNLAGTQIYWNDYYWGEAYWSNAAPTRQVIDVSPAIQPRRLLIVLRQNVSNDKFEIYSANIEALEQAQVFG